jgi:hypothetical protein
MMIRLSFTVSAFFAALLICDTCAIAQLPSPTLTYFSFGGGQYGLEPAAGVIAGQAGKLYGTASAGGNETNCYLGCGTVYEAIPPATASGTWSVSLVYTFQGGSSDGADPGGLVMDSTGTIYGVTYGGGPGPCDVPPDFTGCGTVFSLTPPLQAGGAWTERILYTFTGGADGGGPSAPMVIGHNGVLYGTSSFGGVTGGSCVSEGVASPGCGTVFSLTPPTAPGGTWTFNLLYAFTDFGDGITPGGLVIGPGGIVFGNTVYGGSDNCTYGLTFRGCGTIFSLMRPSTVTGAWTKTVVYSFQGGTDGARPGGVAIGETPGGGAFALYGSTDSGGNQYTCGRGGDGCGTTYMLTPPSAPGSPWTETILTDFPPANGFNPNGSLAAGPSGLLFGVTSGALNSGFTVYALFPPAPSGGGWRKQVLSNFSSASPGSPSNIILSGGQLYGATYNGGNLNGGTVWALLFAP